ncbi:MAG: 4,5-dihydroxyphthalate decarboxylase [Alphaproteobacteria bacterium]|jgi:4,5-dihydroxyphthalate decarboxylase
MMQKLNLSLAIGPYDHVRDVLDGTIPVEGVELNPMIYHRPSKIFHRATNYGDFDICELSFGRQISLVSEGLNEMVAIPVFPSRMPRISGFYIHADSGLTDPKQLAGKRVGVPEWAMTATIYGRGWLAEHIGVDLTSIEWIQGGSDVPGRREPVGLNLPAGIKLTNIADRSLTDMLLAGDIDCILSAQAPMPMRQGDKRIVRLVPEYQQAERDYYAATGIYPIMHVLAIRKSIYEAHPWAALNLFEAFSAAKDAAMSRLPRVNHSVYPVPWIQDYVADLKTLFGDDLWPYGLQANRPTIEAFLRFGADQGVSQRLLSPEELFAPQTLDLAKA